jgi:hypothetical protein
MITDMSAKGVMKAGNPDQIAWRQLRKEGFREQPTYQP